MSSTEDPSPGGTFDNSPTFRRWDWRPWKNKCRRHGWSLAPFDGRHHLSRPSGTYLLLELYPNVETLGSYHMSLRDELRNPTGIELQIGDTAD
jgi:hypothetical protein